MATYYWVGGAGTWDNASTTHWAISSGGAANAGVPTSVDNAIFDTLSNATAYAVTVGTNAVAQDITIAGPLAGNVTITMGATAVINCYGSWLNASSGVVFSATTGATVNMSATTTGKTFTSNNVTLSNCSVLFVGVGGGWTLGSAFTSSSTFGSTGGSLSTGNFAVTASLLSTSGSTTRSITLGSSTVTVSAATPVNIANTTNLTFNAGTSTIVCSNAAPTFTGGGLTYYNVSFTSSGSNASTTITGSNTFNNLSQTTPGSGRRILLTGANQTVNGTLTLGATNTYNQRVQLYSSNNGIPVTFTVATIATLSDVDFRDITAAGASGTWSGTRLGNGLGNTNITFAAGKTVYWNLVAGGNWSANAWATSSGGAVATANFPLAQDTAIIDNTGLTASNTITTEAAWWVSTVNSTRTNAWNYVSTAGLFVYGDFTIPSVTTVSGTSVLTFQGQGLTQTLTTNGVAFTMGFTQTSVGGTLVLDGAVTCASTQTVTLNNGTLNLNNYTLTAGAFSSTNANARTIAFGTGKIVLTGLNTTSWTTQTATNLTLTGTPRVEVSGSGTSTSFTASCSGTALTTTGSPALAAGNLIISATGVSLGTIASGSGNAWVVTIGGTYASQTMVGAQVRIIDAGFTGGTEANSLNFYVTAGVDAISITNQRKYGTIDFTGFAGYVNSDNWVFTIYGNWVLNSSIIGFTNTSSFQGPFMFGATSGTKTVTTAGKTYPVGINFSGVGGTWQLQDNATVPAASTTTLTAGTLNLNNFVLSTGVFASNNSNARTLAFGTGSMTLTGNATTIWTTNTATNLVVTGTPVVNCTYSGATGTRIILGSGTGTLAEAYTVSFNIAAASDIVNPQSVLYKDFIVNNGFTGTLTFSAVTLYGNLNLGGATSIGGTALTFAGTSGTKTITSNGKTIDCPVTFDGVGGTWSLQDAMTMGATRTTALVNGALVLNGFDLSSGLFSSTNTTVRTINFGSNKIVVTGNAATVFSIATATNLTLLGTPQVEATYSGSTGTRQIAMGTTFSSPEANAVSLRVSAGADIVNLTTTSSAYKNVEFTSGFTGTVNIGSSFQVYGNWSFSPNMVTPTTGSGNINFNSTNATSRTITSNGKTFASPLVFNGVGGTWQLQDNLTMAAINTLTLTNGTVDLNNFTFTSGLFSASNSNTRAVAFGTGKLVISGNATSIWNTDTATNFTYTGTGRVELSYSGSTGTRSIYHGITGGTEANSPNFYVTAGTDTVNFTGTGRKFGTIDFTGFGAGTGNIGGTQTVYGNLVLASGMTLTSQTNPLTFGSTSGTKTITTAGKTLDMPITFDGIGGTWAFQDALTMGSTRALTLTNGTIKLKSGTTSTVGSFVTTGTNQTYLQATTSGVQATISDSSGANTATNITIQDSAATGGATWSASNSFGVVNAGNNSGWNFATAISGVSGTGAVGTVNLGITPATLSGVRATGAVGAIYVGWRDVNTTQTPTWTPITTS